MISASLDTGLEYLDRYTWIDDHHVVHQVAELAQWMVKTLGTDRPDALKHPSRLS